MNEGVEVVEPVPVDVDEIHAERFAPAPLLAIYFATIAVFADMYVTQPLLPAISQQFNVTPAVAGTTISAVVLTVALSSSFYGPLSDILGRKRTLVGSSFALAIATLACRFAPTFPFLLLARGFQGLLVPGVSAIAVVTIVETYGARRAPTLIGGYIAASTLGGLIGRVLTGVIADRFAWQSAFDAFAALTLCGCVAMAVFVRSGSASARPPLLADAAHGYRAMFVHLRDARLAGAFVVGASLFFGFIGFFTYLPYYLSAPPFSLSTGTISWFYVAYVMGLIVSPGAGRLSSRISQRAIIAIGSAIVIAGALLSLERNLVTIVISTFVVCAGMFTAQAVAPAFVNRIAVEPKSGANALYQSFYYAGAVFGSIVPGFAWERFAWPGVALTVTASSIVAIAVDGLFLSPQRTRAR